MFCFAYNKGQISLVLLVVMFQKDELNHIWKKNPH